MFFKSDPYNHKKIADFNYYFVSIHSLILLFNSLESTKKMIVENIYSKLLYDA